MKTLSPSAAPPATGAQSIDLRGAGVRYTLLTEDQKTLRGRLSNLFSGAPASAQFWPLRHIDFQARPGEVVGIVGRNGSGKSTLLRLIAGIVEPAEGTVRVTGRMLPTLELGAGFHPELTGRENVYLHGSLLGFKRRETDGMIPHILSFSELGMFFDIPVKTYSSGMVARLAFSVSTQIQPEIVILDEVLGVGDEMFQKKSLMRIRRLIENGVIVLLVAHNAAIVEGVCNRAVYLNKGRVAADGPPRQVLAQYQRDAAAGV